MDCKVHEVNGVKVWEVGDHIRVQGSGDEIFVRAGCSTYGGNSGDNWSVDVVSADGRSWSERISCCAGENHRGHGWWGTAIDTGEITDVDKIFVSGHGGPDVPDWFPNNTGPTDLELITDVVSDIGDSLCPASSDVFKLRLSNPYMCDSITANLDIANRLNGVKSIEVVNLEPGETKEVDFEFEVPGSIGTGFREALNINIESDADVNANQVINRELSILEPGEVVMDRINTDREVCIGNPLQMGIRGRNPGDCDVSVKAIVKNGITGVRHELGPKTVGGGNVIDFEFDETIPHEAERMDSGDVNVELQYNDQGVWKSGGTDVVEILPQTPSGSITG